MNPASAGVSAKRAFLGHLEPITMGRPRLDGGSVRQLAPGQRRRLPGSARANCVHMGGRRNSPLPMSPILWRLR